MNIAELNFAQLAMYVASIVGGLFPICTVIDQVMDSIVKRIKLNLQSLIVYSSIIIIDLVCFAYIINALSQFQEIYMNLYIILGFGVVMAPIIISFICGGIINAIYESYL